MQTRRLIGRTISLYVSLFACCRQSGMDPSTYSEKKKIMTERVCMIL